MRLKQTTDLYERGKIVQNYIKTLPPQDGLDLEGLATSTSMDNLIALSQTLLVLDFRQLDPKFSLQQFLWRLIHGDQVIENAQATQKFRESLEKIKERQDELRKKHDNSSPMKKDGSIKLARPVYQRFYDTYRDFWKSGRVNSAELAQAFEKTKEKDEKEPLNAHRVANYVQDN
jgi:hypothetical protein